MPTVVPLARAAYRCQTQVRGHRESPSATPCPVMSGPGWRSPGCAVWKPSRADSARFRAGPDRSRLPARSVSRGSRHGGDVDLAAFRRRDAHADARLAVVHFRPQLDDVVVADAQALA